MKYRTGRRRRLLNRLSFWQDLYGFLILPDLSHQPSTISDLTWIHTLLLLMLPVIIMLPAATTIKKNFAGWIMIDCRCGYWSERSLIRWKRSEAGWMFWIIPM